MGGWGCGQPVRALPTHWAIPDPPTASPKHTHKFPLAAGQRDVASAGPGEPLFLRHRLPQDTLGRLRWSEQGESAEKQAQGGLTSPEGRGPFGPSCRSNESGVHSGLLATPLHGRREVKEEEEEERKLRCRRRWHYCILSSQGPESSPCFLPEEPSTWEPRAPPHRGCHQGPRQEGTGCSSAHSRHMSPGPTLNTSPLAPKY